MNGSEHYDDGEVDPVSIGERQNRVKAVAAARLLHDDDDPLTHQSEPGRYGHCFLFPRAVQTASQFGVVLIDPAESRRRNRNQPVEAAGDQGSNQIWF
jgi:hypothetical protein